MEEMEKRESTEPEVYCLKSSYRVYKKGVVLKLSYSKFYPMAVSEVNKGLLYELQAMGFQLDQATRALQFSGNSSVEAAIDWIVDHESDPDFDEMPVVVNIEIESPQHSSISEHVKLKAQELRDRTQGTGGKEKEVERGEKVLIQEYKELQEERKIAKEHDNKSYLALKKAEEREEKRAREKIRQKLQQDKVERRSRIGSYPKDPTSLTAAKALVQKNKDSSPSKSGDLPVCPITQLEVMRESLRFLRRQHKHEDTEVKKAFQTLLSYIRNVVNNPNEGKFRKIRVGNPAFQARVGIFKEAIEFLELCGFERVENGKFLHLPSNKINMTLLRSAGSLLQNAMTNPIFGLLSR